MASSSETGHAKNVANFENIMSICTGYGAKYNPGNNALKLQELNLLLNSAKNSLTAVNVALPPFDNAVAARDSAFAPVNKLITRVVNALGASDVPTQTVATAKTISRKIQGKRASDKTPALANDPATPENGSQKSISASQMSFDNRISNLEKLIQLLSAQDGYSPNEPELQVSSLTAVHETLKSTNSAAINALVPLSNTRIERNNLLYAKDSGLVDIAADIKKYIKSVFGATSPQFKQISGLKFTRVKS